MRRPDIVFIVPIHNRWDLAAPLLQSLWQTTEGREDSGYDVIDDGSTQPIPREIEALDAPFRIHRQSPALGFGPTINRAVSRCDAPLVCLLNSDLVLSPGWLEPMLAVMEAQPDAFAVGNVQTAVADGSVDHAGIVFHEEGYPIHFRPDRAFIERQPYREFPAVTAACMLVRRNRFRALGGFEENYRNGFEDVDLCLRARMRGWPSFVANHSWVGHHISASPGRKDHEEANARKFLERWRPLTAVWQRDWENRLLRERRIAAGELPPAAPRESGCDQEHARSSAGREVAGARERAAYEEAQLQPDPVSDASVSQVVEPVPPAIRVMVDLARLGPAGTNGGITVLVREILRALHGSNACDFVFLLIVPDAVVGEVLAWIGPSDEIWSLPGTGVGQPNDDPRIHRLQSADASLARLLAADVLYCPLGVSDYLTPDVPVIGVAVDLLHRELPECLPARDVAARDVWFDRMVRTSFRIQCNSHWVADRVRHHFGATEQQLFVVHNAVHTRLGNPSSRDPGATPVFLYPANAWPHKNHDTLLVAYRLYLEAADSNPWPLVLTGHDDPSMARIAAHARALGLEGKVTIHGYLSDEAFLGIWGRCGALVFPSLHEGFGIPVLEAMHFGIPVVAGPVASIPEVAGDACLFADMRNPRELADALRRISTDEPLRAELIARGRHRAATFTLPPEAAKLANALRDAVSGFRRAGITWRWDANRS